MTDIPETVSHYQKLYREAELALPGAQVPWVAARRRAAMNRFVGLGLPGAHDEEWKYTSLRSIEKRGFALPSGVGHSRTQTDLAPYVFDEPPVHRLVFVDGAFDAGFSQIGGLPEGAILQPLSQALEQGSEVLGRHLGRYADPEGTPFVALNTALMGEGVFVHIPAGESLEWPLHLLFVSSKASEGVGTHYRNVLVAEEGARFTIVESYIGLDEADYFNNVVTEAVAGQRAAIEVYKLQEEATEAYHIATFEGYQHAESEVIHHNISLGGRLVRNDIKDALDAEGAHVTLNGLYLGDGRQHVDNHTLIEHLRPRCLSREFYKGILDGRSRGVFNGKVAVHPQAQKTDSDQQNRNLLLSRNAEVDPKPELEIFADDVSCTHGATVGQLDEDALFFLKTRGLSEEQARNLLIFGFANEIIERIGIEPVRARLEERLFKRLPQPQVQEE